MKQLRLYGMMLSMLAMVVFISCKKDDGGIVIATDLEIGFQTTAVSVVESASAETITVTFPAAPAAVTISAAVTGTATYSDDYTTNPAVSSGSISLSIAKDATSATITFTPVDNDDLDGNRTVIFTLQAADGIELGDNATFTVTITDDEMPRNEVTLADLRAMYVDTEVLFTVDTYISGVVISDLDVNGDQNFTIQDATGGMTLRLTDDEDNTYVRGDEVEVNINGAALDESFFGLLQVTGDPDNDAGYTATLNASAITKLGDGTLPTPTVVTTAELEAGDHESELVTIQSATFTGADGSTVYSDGNSHEISDGSGTSLYRANNTTFEGDLVPYGTGDLTGIASIFFNRQLIAQVDGDQFANMPTTTITVTSNGTNDFGMVETGLESLSQDYFVEVTGSSSIVTITPPNGFLVSLDNVNFGSDAVMLDLTPVRTSVPANVWVRFAPTSGVAGSQSGTLTFQADGALAEEVTVMGEETVASPPLFSESFEDDGNGTRYTTSVAEFSDGFEDYFGRVDDDGITISTSEVVYQNQTGGYFGAMDTDGDGQPANLTLDFTGIDITGQTALNIALSIAEDDDGTNQDWDDVTFFKVHYQIDGGGYNTILAVEAKELRDDATSNATNKAPAIDTNGDGFGDGQEITDTFTEFIMNITNSGGTTLDIRLEFNDLKNGDEDIAVDNLKVEVPQG